MAECSDGCCCVFCVVPCCCWLSLEIGEECGDCAQHDHQGGFLRPSEALCHDAFLLQTVTVANELLIVPAAAAVAPAFAIER